MMDGGLGAMSGIAVDSGGLAGSGERDRSDSGREGEG